MAQFDYGMIGPATPRAKQSLLGSFNTGRDSVRMEQLRNIMGEELGSGTPNVNRMLQGYSQVDPAAALNMIQGGKSGRSSVYAQKLGAMQSPQAQALLNKYTEIYTAISDARVADPTANVSGLIAQANNIATQYKAMTGVPIETATTKAGFSDISKERGIYEGDQDRMQDAVKNITKEVSSQTIEDLKKFAPGAVNLKKAIALMQSSIKEDGSMNAPAINSALKIYVQSLDDSAVMQGEMAAIGGNSIIDQVMGFINQVTTGVSISETQLRNFWASMMTLGEVNNQALENIKDQLSNEITLRLRATNTTGEIANIDGDTIAGIMDDLVASRIDKYKVVLVSESKTPAFKDAVIDIFSKKQAPRSGGTKVNPLANVDF